MVVHILLRRERPSPQVFLLRRAGTGFLDGYYALPGGHVQAGELPLAAAARECIEETACVPTELTPVCVMPYRSAGQVGMNLIYQCQQFTGSPSIAEPESADVALWANETALPQPSVGWIGSLLDMVRSGRWYREFDPQ